MKRPVNPYVAGAPLRGETGFFGRRDVLDWTSRELSRPDTNALVLYGQRRIGKTSLLLQLRTKLPAEAFLPIYFDLQDQATQPLDVMLAELSDVCSERVGMEPPKAGAFENNGPFFRRTFLPQLCNAVGDSRRPVFLFDEFDVLDQVAEVELPKTTAARALFPLLRQVMAENLRPAFVFVVGRRADDLSLDFRATFKASLGREVWVLDRASGEALARQAEDNETLTFTDGAVDRLLQLTNCHPYLIQLLAQRIWERAYGRRPSAVPRIGVEEVEAAVPEALQVGYQALAWLWDGLSPAERIYAAALAEAAAEGDNIPEDRVIDVLTTYAPRLHTREVELAPRELEKRRILEGAGKGEYRFAVELIRRWIRKHRPLHEVKDELDRQEPIAEQLFRIGQQSFRQRKWPAAAEFFQRALDENSQHFRARLFLGETYLELGETGRAVAALHQAYDLDREEARLPFTHALVAHAEHLWSSGDGPGALAACERALALSPGEEKAKELTHTIASKREPGKGKHAVLATALATYRLGKFLLRNRWRLTSVALLLIVMVGMIGLATKTANRALGVKQAGSLQNDAARLRVDGQIGQAIELEARSLALFRDVGERGRTAVALQNMASSYSLLGMEEEALDALGEALEIHQARGDPNGEAVCRTEIGWLLYRRGEPEAAIDQYLQALELHQDEGNRRPEIRTLDRLGTAYRSLGRFGEARDSYQKALAIAQKTGSRLEEAQTLTNLAELHVDQAEPDRAMATAERALALFAEQGDSHGQARALFERARAQAARGELAAARTSIEHTLEIVERGTLASEALSLPFLATRRIYYEFYRDLLMRLHIVQPEGGYDGLALEAEERRRARGLLVANRSQIGQPELEVLRARIRALEVERIRLADDFSHAEIQRVEEQLGGLLRGLGSAEGPAAEAKGRPVGVSEIQQELLDADSLLLVYALGDEGSFLWAVSSTSLASYELPPREQIRSAAQRAYNLLPQSHRLERQSQSQLAAMDLARMLLASVSERLESRRVLVVGDEILKLVPFSALPEPGSGEPLILRHEIVRLPSASVLAMLRRRAAGRTTPQKTLAVIADPVFDPSDPRLGAAAKADPESLSVQSFDLTRAAEPWGLREFARLPGMREEAEAILALVPPSDRLVALDFAASRETVVSGELRGFRILHFATHGLVHHRHPELSGLVLSLVDEQGRPRDGFLRASEICGLDLPAELVVLSSCSSALGTRIGDEGLIDLPRSFMYAGATRVLVNLWRVDDRATAELMARFYRRMVRDGLAPAAALREAQVSMLGEDRWEAPYYWAGFELQGEWR